VNGFRRQDSARIDRRTLVHAAAGAVGAAAGIGAVGKPAQALAQEDSAATADAVEAALADLSPAERAAQCVVVPVGGAVLVPDEAAWLSAARPGGVILTAANMGTPDEIAELVAAIRATNPDVPPFVCVDQEGGLVSRVPGDPAPNAPMLGTLPPTEVAAFAAERARFLAGFGFDVNFAPVADVAWTADSFMAGRCFGSDPAAVAEAVAGYVEGASGSAVHHCAKHFPGHGRPTVDSHLALPEVGLTVDEWAATDALPFAAAVDAGVPLVMLGHLRYPAWDDLPASISPVAVDRLRQDLGFGGVVVSDDLGMGALADFGALEVVELAVAAGVDLLVYVTPALPPADLIGYLAGLVESGAVPASRIDASVRRLLALKLGRGATAL
jgi:beta-N-acetylhexosaminidase